MQHKPMVLWIWLGCLIMAAGGALAVSDRRYRTNRLAAQPPVAQKAKQAQEAHA